MIDIRQGDVTEVLQTLPAKHFHCAVTSPPYWGLRDYSVDGQLGLERLHDCQGWATGNKCGACFICKMVAVFREVRRVLRDDSVLVVNLGDSYANPGNNRTGAGETRNTSTAKFHGGKAHFEQRRTTGDFPGLKPKDLCGIPWRFALAMQADGWFLRSDMIWCISGGTWLYARTQKGDMPVMVRDLARLKSRTVQLWNGEKWTPLLGINKSKRKGDELEVVLRSGERISCTPTHRFPTNRGLLEAGALQVGDILAACCLPESETVKDCAIDDDAAWFAGLFIAEGSRSGDTIQIAGHSKEIERWERVQRVAAKFGGTATMTVNGNNMAIRVYGKVLNAIIDELTTGRTAKNKGFAIVVWRYSNQFIAAMVGGYLSGDGHWDKKATKWKLGFCRNYNLERDLRVACARLGYSIRLRLYDTKFNGKTFPSIRGDLVIDPSNRRTNDNQIVAINKARCREVYDLGVADEPHLFSLASGVLTHNSKPNPMPESVTDRPTKAHEYVFLFSKAQRYFWDAVAVKETSTEKPRAREKNNGESAVDTKMRGHDCNCGNSGARNLRTVLTIPTEPTPYAHFATFPKKLVEPFIKAGTSQKGCCAECGAPWVRVVEKERVRKGATPHIRDTTQAGNSAMESLPARLRTDASKSGMGTPRITTTGWRPTCNCNAGVTKCRLLDPFGGSATTGIVAEYLGRDSVMIELSQEYIEIAKRRINEAAPGAAELPSTGPAQRGLW